MLFAGLGQVVGVALVEVLRREMAEDYLLASGLARYPSGLAGSGLAWVRALIRV